jgi:uncharacterized protein
MYKQKHLLLSVFAIYFFCFFFRILEYFIVRTDYTIFGEAFIHKILGIIILVIAAHLFSYKPGDIGFTKESAAKKILWGMGFGLIVYLLSYLLEIVSLERMGTFKKIGLYVTSYSVNGNVGNHTKLIFFIICVIGNGINVIMEEGLFRGLFQKILEQKYKFMTSAVIASLLFGIWHVVGPVRSFTDGLSNTSQLIGNIIVLVLTSGLVGFKYALLSKLTGSVYMAMGDHFVNNTIINILHVLSNTGADELLNIRITIAQSVSFLVVLLLYLLNKHRFVTDTAA